MYIKLRFFRRIHRFIRNQARKSHCTAEPTTMIEKEANQDSPPCHTEENSFLDAKEEEEEKEVLCLLRRSVKALHFGDTEEKKRAASVIGRLAKEDFQTKRSLAVLGVIPPLVDMLGSEFTGHRTSALQALVEIANDSNTNKCLMVEAGFLQKLSKILQQDPDQPSKQELAIILLSMSTLPDAQRSIASAPILLFLLDTLNSKLVNKKEMLACLASLYNISTILENSEALVSNGAVPTLMKLVSEEDYAERALATLGNLVVTVSGKHAIENHNSMPHRLIEVISCENKLKCQESAAYILMILAHKSPQHREKMAEAGIIPVLLEVSLLGSPLAQKRALKILHWFKDERMKGTAPHSGPQMAEMMSPGSPLSVKEMKEGRRAIRMMVQESLNKNMESIMKRAKSNCTNPPAASTLKAFVSTASSKSLPY